MDFYKVPKKLGGKSVKRNIFLVTGELLTVKEAQKLGCVNLLEKEGEKVRVSKFKTYWFFGARFESKLKN